MIPFLFLHQQIFSKYKTVSVNFNKDENKSLVWVGAFLIANPKTITKTVPEYVEALINKLENQDIIPQH